MPKPLPQNEIERRRKIISAGLSDGMTLAAIADQNGMSRAAVYEFTQRHMHDAARYAERPDIQVLRSLTRDQRRDVDTLMRKLRITMADAVDRVTKRPKKVPLYVSKEKAANLNAAFAQVVRKQHHVDVLGRTA